MTPKQRTSAQNNSLHKGLRLIAEQLREKELSVQTVLAGGIELEWTETLLKETIFKPICKLMFDCDSTTQLTTKQLQEAWENMSRAIAKTGCYVPFPSMESEMLENLYLKN